MDQFPNTVPSSSTDRWEALKPFIEQLYLVDKMKLTDVISTMKGEYNFDAYEREYKYHFKKWQWRKSVPTSAKKKIVGQLQSRARLDKAVHQDERTRRFSEYDTKLSA